MTSSPLPMPNHPFELICAAICDANRYMIESLSPRPNPYMPDRLPFIHFSDDDTDYLPAASDLIACLTRLICDDEPDYDNFFDALATCRSIDDNDTPCIHHTALDASTALDPYIRDSDDCPHLA